MYLPYTRLTLGSAPPKPLSPVDVARVTDTGWQWEASLPDRLLYGSIGSGAAGDAIAIRPGRRPSPWRHNVLALGDAAVAVDPLQGMNLHLAHAGIARALELLPGRDCHPLELKEYNRRIGQETGRVRDFLALHYRRADRPLPPDLARTLTQFERRGRLPFFEEDVPKESWLAALLGLGILPAHDDPAVATVDPAAATAAMQRLAANYAAMAAQLPPYAAYLSGPTPAAAG